MVSQKGKILNPSGLHLKTATVLSNSILKYDALVQFQYEKNNVKDHLDNDHQQTKPPQTVYWYECYLCGLYVDSNVSLEDAKKKFD